MHIGSVFLILQSTPIGKHLTRVLPVMFAAVVSYMAPGSATKEAPSAQYAVIEKKPKKIEKSHYATAKGM